MNNIFFTEKELENYADVMFWGLVRAKKKNFEANDIIQIRYDHNALPLAEKIYNKIIVNGCLPYLRPLLSPDMEVSFFSRSNESQLMEVPEFEIEITKKIAGSISILSPNSLDHLKNIESEKISMVARSRSEIKKILDSRERNGDFSWTLCIYPSTALAEQSKMSIDEYSEKISRACFLKEDNPVEIWRSIARRSDDIKTKLKKLDLEYIHVISDSIDLTLKPGEKRKWLGISGRNIPSFEIFISPDSRSINGRYYANQVSFRNGNIVSGIRLEFIDGKIVKASAEKGEEYLIRQLETDEGSSMIGEFSMTDRNFSKIDSFMANTLFDENYGGEFGNIHIAIGSSYSNSFDGPPEKFSDEIKKELGFNSSSIHWDIVNTEKKEIFGIKKTGEKILLYKDGEFKI